MTDNSWPGIRAGAQRAEVYNEALVVYLYDQANLPVLKESGADFQTGFAEEESDTDPQLKKLAKAGMFVAYELLQDDGIRVEVVVGPPLTKKELAVGRWHKPQRALLQLPSGELRIDSANTLPIHEDPADQPGLVAVPPGEYAVTLYRLDWDELRNDGLVTDEEDEGEARLWMGPEEVVVLTPLAEAKPVRGLKSLLRFPQKSSAVWRGRYRIDGPTFHGKAMTHYWWDNIFVNVDRPAAETLGLQPGLSFRLEVADFTFDVIYYGDADLQDVMHLDWAKPLAGDRPEFGVAYRPRGVPGSEHFLTFPRVVSTRPFPKHERWMPATLTLLPDRYEIPRAPQTMT